MGLEASFNNVFVEGNTIDQGTWSNGTSNTTYNYTGGRALITTSSVIRGNTFENPTAMETMLTLGDTNNAPSCIVSENKFIRGSTSITFYIDYNFPTSPGDYIIVDNIFDQTTVDGTSTDLIDSSSFFPPSIYTNNINQPYNIVTGIGSTSSLNIGTSWSFGSSFNFLTGLATGGTADIHIDNILNGHTANFITFYYQINGSPRSPGTRLSLIVNSVLISNGTVTPLHSSSPLTVPVYSAFSTPLSATFTLNQLNTIDISNYWYYVKIIEETGAGASAGNAVFGFSINYT